MSSATMTMIGMYNFDNDLFELLTTPEGIDKQTLIDTILLRSGEFEVMYPDLDFLKYSIGAWSRKWNPTLERWSKALKAEYNPLENYDRQEEWTDNGTSNGSESGSSNGSTSGQTGSLTTNKASANDAGDAFTNKDATAVNGTDSTTSLGSSSLNKNDSFNNSHKGRIHGNIGVTTSQQMLLSELDLGYWNIYEKIADIFLTEFVLPIY